MRMLNYVVLFFLILLACGCGQRHASLPDTSHETPLTLEQFGEQWRIIVDNFIHEMPDTPEARLACFQKLIAKGLEECVGDSHSHYMPKEKAAAIYEELEGFYAGVGLKLSDTGDPVTIVSIIEGSPAEKSGMFEAGDAIMEVDGQDVSKESNAVVAAKIRGSADTPVILRVKRNGSVRDPVVMTRERIIIPSVHTVDIDDEIAYIKIDEFNKQTPGALMNAMIHRLLVRLQGTIWAVDVAAKKFAIDLRGNPGGSVEAVGMAGYVFADGDDDIVLTIRSRAGDEVFRAGEFVSSTSKIPAGVFRGVKIVLLIDGGSASAAEILAEFLHQTLGIARVGTRSFGKGSVQQIFPLEGGDAIYLTIAEYMVGNRNVTIEKIGIQPEYEVEDAPAKERAQRKLGDPANDPPLRKAITLLRQPNK